MNNIEYCSNYLDRLQLLGFPGGSVGKESEMQETQLWSLDVEGPLEKGIATHSRILAWRIPWTEKLRRLQSMRSQRVGHNWVTNTFTFTFTFTAHMFGGQLLSRTLLRETVLSFPQKFQGYFLESCINGPRCLDCHKINWMNFTLEQYPYSIRMY